MIELKKQSHSVLILGKGQSRRMAFDVVRAHRRAIPIWTLNNDWYDPMSTIENLHFEIHDPMHHSKESIISNFKSNVPNFSKDKLKILTRSDYPLQQIMEKFNTTFLGNCIAFEIALACYLGYNTIYLCGVDQFMNPKLANQERMSVEFWIGVAHGLGMQIKKPNSGQLFKGMSPDLVANYFAGQKAAVGETPNAEYLHNIELLYK